MSWRRSRSRDAAEPGRAVLCASVSLCVWEDEKTTDQVLPRTKGNIAVCLWKSRAGTQHPSQDGTSRVGVQGSVQGLPPGPGVKASASRAGASWGGDVGAAGAAEGACWHRTFTARLDGEGAAGKGLAHWRGPGTPLALGAASLGKGFGPGRVRGKERGGFLTLP